MKDEDDDDDDETAKKKRNAAAKAKGKAKAKKDLAKVKKSVVDKKKKEVPDKQKTKTVDEKTKGQGQAANLAALFDNEASSSDEEAEDEDEDEDMEDEEEEAEKEEEKKEPETKEKKPVKEEALSAKFYEKLRARMQDKKDLGKEQADTIRLGEGAHWKRRYYSEKFAVAQEDLVDFLQRIRKAYIEGLCWVLRYYYQGVCSWTWFYPYHYAPFGSDLIGMSSLKCSDDNYFALGKGFQPVQQLMAVLPPVSAKAAGIPKSMMTLMEMHDSPIADFFPTDFGLDLNGKRFAWQGVVLLPFIDEPRLLRILAPLLAHLSQEENDRNKHSTNCLFGRVDDLKKKLPPKGSTNKRQLKDHFLFGYVTGQYGAGEEIISPIEGLPDVDESECVETKYDFPDRVTHSVELLEGATFEPQMVDQADLDDMVRLKGFGGMQARKVIAQALGIYIGGKKGGKKGKKGDFGKGGKDFKGGKDSKGGKKGKKGAPAPMLPVPVADIGPRRPGRPAADAGRAAPY